MTEIKSKTLPNGYKVVVSIDPDPQSPREWDNIGTVVIHNRSRYAFADETASMDELQALESDKSLICLPIYLYDHSGITINTTGFTCRWDSGQVGVIYCTKETAVKEFGKTLCTEKVKAKALKRLEGEIEVLDTYLTGEAYGYRVLDHLGQEVHSCWGFYGDSNYALQEGIAEAKAMSRFEEGSTAEQDLAILGDAHCCGEELLRSVCNK